MVETLCGRPWQSVLSRSRRLWTGVEPADTQDISPGALPVELPRPGPAPVSIPFTEHAPTDRRPTRRVRRGPDGTSRLLERDAGGSRTHFRPGCSRSPGRLAPASYRNRNAPARSRTWPSTFAGSRASLTLRGRNPHETAFARNRTWSSTFEASRASPAHSEGICKAPGREESNLVVAGFGGPPPSQGHIPKAVETIERKGRDSNPHAPKAHSLAARPGQPYPAPFQRIILSVDRRGVEPRLPVCRTGVFPFDQQPISRTRESSRQDSNLRLSCL